LETLLDSPIIPPARYTLILAWLIFVLLQLSMLSETTTTLQIPDLLKDWPWALKVNPSYSDRMRDEENFVYL
jgi:hypothetical protein